jgi:hypothetical protein
VACLLLAGPAFGQDEAADNERSEFHPLPPTTQQVMVSYKG